MAEEDNALIKFDLAQFKLHVNIQDKISLSLQFDSKSRRFYLAVIALVLYEMKKSGKTTSIPLEKHYDTLALLNETVGGQAGSSDKEKLLPRIYRKWRHALPDLEHSPLFRVLGKKKEYDDAGGKTYRFTDEEKDAWANLFDYRGSHEKVRLRFSIDKLGLTLDDILITYPDESNLSDGNGWDSFLKNVNKSTEEDAEQTAKQKILTEPVDQKSTQSNFYTDSTVLDLQKAEEEKLNMIQRYLPTGLTEKIIAQRGKIEGERKLVTVMFCNIDSYSALFERLDPEEFYSIMDEFFELLINRVHDYGGTVNEMSSDGIMALFGAPIAQENSPQRAIRSALDIHREMVKFGNRMKIEKQIPPFKIRIGIHTGPVVVGSIGNDLRVEFKAVGETVKLASKMEELAEPGTTCVTQDTYKLTEGLFLFEATGARRVKGKKKPFRTYRVISPTTMRTRFDVNAERGLTPFVGREKELELLLEGYQRAREGRGQVFSIVSEAGVGKSRLLYEFRKVVASEDATFLEGRCLSYRSGTAYHPIIDLLKSNFNIQDSDGELKIKEKVTKGLRAIEADDSFTSPYLLELLGVKDTGMDMTGMNPEIKKSRILDALKRIVLKGSEMPLLVMAVEDLHWSDPSSEETFKYLLDNILGANVLLIFTYRPEFVHTWAGKSYHNQLNLNRLSNRESLSMVTHLLGTEDFESDLGELVLEKTEGVPFFIEELIKSLKELNMIEIIDGKCRGGFQTRPEIAIPSTIQDVIMARVDLLPDDAKRVLQTGSVIGKEFSYDLIKNVTGLPERELLSQLAIPKDLELVYERGIFPESTYIFKHALTHDVVYNSILSKKKTELHAAIGKAIEEIYEERLEEFYEVLAHHYTEANLIKQAISYWQQAGQRLGQRSAYAEAISHITKGINLLKTLPDTTERAQLELVLQNSLGQALTAIESHAAPKVEQAYARAHELCRKVGETPQLFSVFRGLVMFYYMRGELKTAKQLGEQFLNLANRQQDPAILLTANLSIGQVLPAMGEFISAREHLEEGITLYDPQQHRFTVGEPGAVLYLSSTLALWPLGYPDLALERSRKGLSLANEASHPYCIGWSLAWAAQLHRLRGEVEVCQEKAEAAILICTKQGFPLWLAMAKILRGWALVTQGQGEEGILLIRQGMANWQSAGVLVMPTRFFDVLADAYKKLGHTEEGLRVLAEALSLVNKIGVRGHEAELHRFKGELLLAPSEGNQTEAEISFHKALEVSRRQHAKSFELRAATSLGRLWQSQGKREEARDLLAPVYDWFTEGFDTADLKDAKLLLEELS